MDRALAIGLVDTGGLSAELNRLAKPGRAGVGRLRRALEQRGMVASPHPSVLESRLLRLLERHGIIPLGTEVVVVGEAEWGGYRLDVLIASGLAVEVDGFRYHHSPEQKTADERRRNRLRLRGIFLLVYTWWDVVHEPRRVIAEIRDAMAKP